MSQYAHPEVLVDTQWLMEHLQDPLVRIIEVDLSPEPCQNARISGAIFWNVLTDLVKPDFRMNLDPEAIADLFSRSGITPETTVIAYGSIPDVGAWIFWFLKLFGHQNVLVLNGGHKKWLAEARPVVKEFAQVAPTKYPVPSINQSLRVPLPEVQASLNQPDSVFLDARSLGEYSGEIFMRKPPEGDERGGHIPGAIHLEHMLALNEDGTYKSKDNLQSLYAEQGVTPDKEIVPYCAIGARSASVWFVLKYLLGYPKVRNYDGSWNEWSRLPNAQIEN